MHTLKPRHSKQKGSCAGTNPGHEEKIGGQWWWGADNTTV